MTRSRIAAALGIAGVAMLAAGAIIGPDPLFGRITSYAATCLRRGPDQRCVAVGRTLGRNVFRVSVARQHVEVFSARGEPVALHACAVTARTDWRCRSVDGSFDLGFSDGQPWMRLPGEAASDIVFLSRWRYIWLQSGEPHPALRPIPFGSRR
jgi:hypothetical protein